VESTRCGLVKEVAHRRDDQIGCPDTVTVAKHSVGHDPNPPVEDLFWGFCPKGLVQATEGDLILVGSRKG